MLGQHSHIFWDREIYQRLFHSYEHAGLADYVKHLQRLGFSHFVILKRKNYLRTIVSSLVARKQGRFHQPFHEPAILTRIYLDVNHVQNDREEKPLVAFLHDYTHHFSHLDQLLNSLQVIRLTYEDDIAEDPNVGYERICRFLKIPDSKVLIAYSRTTPFRLTDILLNFDEVGRALDGTPFEWMLDA